jgi:hypothetical protein
MKMKKKIAIVAVVAALGLTGMTQAYGGWGNRGGGNDNCPMIQNGQMTQLDPALQEKRDTFFTDTQEIRKEMAMKQSEKQAMLRGDNPDPQAVSKISGELFDLRTTLRQKADEAGLPGAFGPKGRGGFSAGMNGRGFDQGMNSRKYGRGMNGPGFDQGVTSRGYGPDMNGPGYGPGMGRSGKGGRKMGYMGNPGYGQGQGRY